MNRSVTLMVVLLIASLTFITIFAVSEGAVPQLPQPPVNPETLYKEPNLPGMPGTVKPSTELDFLADPNKIRARLKAVEGLEEALTALDGQGQEEMPEWLQRTTDNRMTLTNTVEKQVSAELALIRKIAVGEKAVKTVAAIDGIALNRQERSKKLLRKMEEEARSLRQPRGTRGRSRNMPPEGAAVSGQGYRQDVNQPRFQLRRR
jgi:hypothetical protein